MSKTEKRMIIASLILWFSFWYWAITSGHADLFEKYNKLDARMWEVRILLDKRIKLLMDLEEQRIRYEP